MPGVITYVQPGGTGDEIGLRPGDAIVAVDGRPVLDELDYRFAMAADEALVLVRSADGREWEVELEEKDYDDALGVAFESPVFDGVRECANRCVFCFVDQMPSDGRATSLIHDDDYRLSFLAGNFITLTNLTEEDLERVISQRMSPLYASIHATDQEARRRLFRSKAADRALPTLARLVEAGVEVHTQIVLTPGYNDGAVLERTVRDLADLHPGVASIGIVPVGLTRHREGLTDLRCVTPDEARAVLASVARWQAGFLDALDTRLCFAADEFYILAEAEFPPPEAYEDMPQYENGIGMWASLREELRESLPEVRPAGKATIATGTSLAPLLAREIADAGLGESVVVRPVENRYLGPTVTVAGLLAGRDILRAVTPASDGLLVLPAAALNDDELFIDSTPLSALRERGAVAVVSDAGDLARALETGSDDL